MQDPQGLQHQAEPSNSYTHLQPFLPDEGSWKPRLRTGKELVQARTARRLLAWVLTPLRIEDRGSQDPPRPRGSHSRNVKTGRVGCESAPRRATYRPGASQDPGTGPHGSCPAGGGGEVQASRDSVEGNREETPAAPGAARGTARGLPRRKTAAQGCTAPATRRGPSLGKQEIPPRSGPGPDVPPSSGRRAPRVPQQLPHPAAMVPGQGEGPSWCAHRAERLGSARLRRGADKKNSAEEPGRCSAGGRSPLTSAARAPLALTAPLNLRKARAPHPGLQRRFNSRARSQHGGLGAVTALNDYGGALRHFRSVAPLPLPTLRFPGFPELKQQLEASFRTSEQP